jgi:hypothetical protein
MYNLVLPCRSFKVTATATGSFLGCHCAAVHMFRIYDFRWLNSLLVTENTAVGIRHDDHVAPSIHKSWH